MGRAEATEPQYGHPQELMACTPPSSSCFSEHPCAARRALSCGLRYAKPHFVRSTASHDKAAQQSQHNSPLAQNKDKAIGKNTRGN